MGWGEVEGRDGEGVCIGCVCVEGGGVRVKMGGEGGREGGQVQLCIRDAQTTGSEWAVGLARRHVGPGKVYNMLVVAEQRLKGSEKRFEGRRQAERKREGWDVYEGCTRLLMRKAITPPTHTHTHTPPPIPG